MASSLVLTGISAMSVDASLPESPSRLIASPALLAFSFIIISADATSAASASSSSSFTFAGALTRFFAFCSSMMAFCSRISFSRASSSAASASQSSAASLYSPKSS
ncbi:uncharacterized protein Tco025E_00056 [Trypanosoma conorhini]|uniref:Uncharacterized protein n=1 Tax=Trypanosoma conorhini TaxID=83891 RepID=A0A3R7Q045_9TRYP|nr:uncharacterized protein Tco025E_00056 [Trypanosoma conorhini]RNF27672.1 hypothetical protein Tco025E_00056 [Trypanosoma conorhini]